MDWVYMAPELPGQDLFAGSGQDRIGFAVGDDYVVDPGAVQALQVNYPLHHAALTSDKLVFPYFFHQPTRKV